MAREQQDLPPETVEKIELKRIAENGRTARLAIVSGIILAGVI